MRSVEKGLIQSSHHERNVESVKVVLPVSESEYEVSSALVDSAAELRSHELQTESS